MYSKVELARRFGVSQKTIDNWARAANLRPAYRGKKRVFSESDAAAIAKVAGTDLPAAPTVDSGNHSLAVQADLPARYSLDSLRIADQVAFADPLAVASAIVAAATQVEVAMRGDVASRQAKLQATQQARAQVAAAIAGLQQEQLIYRLQTAAIDTATSAATGELQALLAQLQQLEQKH